MPDADRRPPARRRGRDRHGRGLRGDLAPVGVPLHRTPPESFDHVVLGAVEHLEQHWGDDLAAVEFAIEDVPSVEEDDGLAHDTVVDRGVPLGRLYRDGLPDLPHPLIVLYRRPIETRTEDREDRAQLVFSVVTDLAAEFLGKDPDDLDPPH